MKKRIAALALALTLAAALASCSSRDPYANHTTGANDNQNGMTSGNAAVPGSTAGSTSGAAGTVSRRYGGETTYNTYNTYNTGKYFDDGRYTAGPNGRVYNDNTRSHDLTQDARNMIRDAGDAIGDAGRDIKDMFTGSGNDAVRDRTALSREPDSSAVRF